MKGESECGEFFTVFKNSMEGLISFWYFGENDI